MCKLLNAISTYKLHQYKLVFTYWRKKSINFFCLPGKEMLSCWMWGFFFLNYYYYLGGGGGGGSIFQKTWLSKRVCSHGVVIKLLKLPFRSLICWWLDMFSALMTNDFFSQCFGSMKSSSYPLLIIYHPRPPTHLLLSFSTLPRLLVHRSSKAPPPLPLSHA